MPNSDATFLYYIKNGSGAYYSVTHEGYVTAGTEAKPLQNSPDGWKGEQLTYARHETFWGIFTQYKIDLQFIKDGAKILRYIFYREGFEGNGTLEVRKLNTKTRQYSLWTTCDIDFSQFTDTKDYVTVFLKDKGGLEYLQSVQNTPYEIPLDDWQALNLYLNGLKIKNTVSWSPFTFIDSSNVDNYDITDLNIVYRTSELGKYYTPDNVVQLININSDESNWYAFKNYFHQATTTDSIQLQIKNCKLVFVDSVIDGTPAVGYKGRWEIVQVRTDNTIVSTQTIHSFPTDWQGEYLLDDISVSFSSVQIGDRFFLRFKYNVLIGIPHYSFEVQNIDDSRQATMYMSGSFLQFTPTTNKAFRYFDFASKLINLATNGQYTLQSQFLSSMDSSYQRRSQLFGNIPSNTLVTSGDGIRGIDNAVIKTTIADMFKDVWSRWCCGISIQGDIIKIEPLSTLLSDAEALKVGKVNNFKFYPYTDKIVNQIHIGYNDYSYDELSGKEEFNTGQTWLIQNVKRITKEDDLISPYRADMFGWEYLRNQKSEAATQNPDIDTVDDTSDNDVFMIEVDDAQQLIDGNWYYVPYRSDIQVIAGLSSPDSAYNITLSPKRSLYRHLPRIMSFMDKGDITFQTTDKNDELYSLDTWFIDEDATIHLQNLSPIGMPITKLYQSLAFEFDCAAPYNFAEIMANALNGYISFEWNGIIMKGYILDVGVTPATRDTYTFKVLSHKDNDLTKLIH